MLASLALGANKQISTNKHINKQTNKHEEYYSDKPVMYDRDGLDKDGADEVCETNVEQDLRYNI